MGTLIDRHPDRNVRLYGHFTTGGMDRACSTIAGCAAEGDNTMRTTANLAGTLLLGLMIADVPFGGSAVAQEPITREDYVSMFFGLPLLADLFSEPPAETEERQLRAAAADYSRAQAAWSEGPSAAGYAEVKFETARGNLRSLAKNARRPKVRKLARTYLSRLPQHFVRGFAYQRDDGTVAADPDWQVWHQLNQDRYSYYAGDGDAD